MVEENRKKDDQAVPKEELGRESIESDAGAIDDPAKQDNKLIDMEQAIEMLKTTRSTFYRWLRAGKIKGMKIGRQWRFYREDIDCFLRGDKPRIDLPADIGPFIKTLRERAEELGVKDVSPPDANEVQETVNLMISLGAKMGASDIHLSPHVREVGEDNVAVLRYRLDGVLHPFAEIDIRLLPAIIEQWKRIAGCDVLEKEKPQEGRVTLKLEGESIDLRVCFLPTGLGESLTGRIMNMGSSLKLKFEDLDFAPQDKEKILRWIESPWGIIIVSGPVGSGKTTVLYACLDHVSRPEIKVLTVEDPVEFLLPWAVQVQIHPDSGITYPVALRSIFRSDPDVIMVGQMSELESLHLAQQLALTGHLVMTSMHANDAVSVFKYMVEMGGDPFTIGESTKLITAQRLVRRLCPACSVEKTPPAERLEQVAKIAYAGGLDWISLPKKFREPVGCDECKGTGYRGRTLIAEVLEITPEITTALSHDASLEELRNIAIEQGMTTMAANGLRLAALGATSITETMRVAST